VAHKVRYFEPIIQKTTVSTTLAKGEERKTTDIPPEFRKYAKVFSDEEAQRLPKHQPWDHKIDLQPGLHVTAPLIYLQFTRLSVTYRDASTDVMPTFLICVNPAHVPAFRNLPLSRYLATIS